MGDAQRIPKALISSGSNNRAFSLRAFSQETLEEPLALVLGGVGRDDDRRIHHRPLLHAEPVRGEARVDFLGDRTREAR